MADTVKSQEELFIESLIKAHGTYTNWEEILKDLVIRCINNDGKTKDIDYPLEAIKDEKINNDQLEKISITYNKLVGRFKEKEENKPDATLEQSVFVYPMHLEIIEANKSGEYWSVNINAHELLAGFYLEKMLNKKIKNPNDNKFTEEDTRDILLRVSKIYETKIKIVNEETKETNEDNLTEAWDKVIKGYSSDESLISTKYFPKSEPDINDLDIYYSYNVRRKSIKDSSRSVYSNTINESDEIRNKSEKLFNYFYNKNFYMTSYENLKDALKDPRSGDKGDKFTYNALVEETINKNDSIVEKKDKANKVVRDLLGKYRIEKPDGKPGKLPEEFDTEFDSEFSDFRSLEYLLNDKRDNFSVIDEIRKINNDSISKVKEIKDEIGVSSEKNIASKKISDDIDKIDSIDDAQIEVNKIKASEDSILKRIKEIETKLEVTRDEKNEKDIKSVKKLEDNKTKAENIANDIASKEEMEEVSAEYDNISSIIEESKTDLNNLRTEYNAAVEITKGAQKKVDDKILSRINNVKTTFLNGREESSFTDKNTAVSFKEQTLNCNDYLTALGYAEKAEEAAVSAEKAAKEVNPKTKEIETLFGKLSNEAKENKNNKDLKDSCDTSIINTNEYARLAREAANAAIARANELKEKEDQDLLNTIKSAAKEIRDNKNNIVNTCLAGAENNKASAEKSEDILEVFNLLNDTKQKKENIKTSENIIPPRKIAADNAFLKIPEDKKAEATEYMNQIAADIAELDKIKTDNPGIKSISELVDDEIKAIDDRLDFLMNDKLKKLKEDSDSKLKEAIEIKNNLLNLLESVELDDNLSYDELNRKYNEALKYKEGISEDKNKPISIKGCADYVSEKDNDPANEIMKNLITILGKDNDLLKTPQDYKDKIQNNLNDIIALLDDELNERLNKLKDRVNNKLAEETAKKSREETIKIVDNAIKDAKKYLDLEKEAFKLEKSELNNENLAAAQSHLETVKDNYNLVKSNIELVLLHEKDDYFKDKIEEAKKILGEAERVFYEAKKIKKDEEEAIIKREQESKSQIPVRNYFNSSGEEISAEEHRSLNDKKFISIDEYWDFDNQQAIFVDVFLRVPGNNSVVEWVNLGSKTIGGKKQVIGNNDNIVSLEIEDSGARYLNLTLFDHEFTKIRDLLATTIGLTNKNMKNTDDKLIGASSVKQTETKIELYYSTSALLNNLKIRYGYVGDSKKGRWSDGEMSKTSFRFAEKDGSPITMIRSKEREYFITGLSETLSPTGIKYNIKAVSIETLKINQFKFLQKYVLFRDIPSELLGKFKKDLNTISNSDKKDEYNFIIDELEDEVKNNIDGKDIFFDYETGRYEIIDGAKQKDMLEKLNKPIDSMQKYINLLFNIRATWEKIPDNTIGKYVPGELDILYGEMKSNPEDYIGSERNKKISIDKNSKFYTAYMAMKDFAFIKNNGASDDIVLTDFTEKELSLLTKCINNISYNSDRLKAASKVYELPNVKRDTETSKEIPYKEYVKLLNIINCNGALNINPNRKNTVMSIIGDSLIESYVRSMEEREKVSLFINMNNSFPLPLSIDIPEENNIDNIKLPSMYTNNSTNTDDVIGNDNVYYVPGYSRKIGNIEDISKKSILFDESKAPNYRKEIYYDGVLCQKGDSDFYPLHNILKKIPCGKYAQQAYIQDVYVSLITFADYGLIKEELENNKNDSVYAENYNDMIHEFCNFIIFLYDAIIYNNYVYCNDYFNYISDSEKKIKNIQNFVEDSEKSTIEVNYNKTASDATEIKHSIISLGFGTSESQLNNISSLKEYVIKNNSLDSKNISDINEKSKCFKALKEMMKKVNVLCRNYGAKEANIGTLNEVPEVLTLNLTSLKDDWLVSPVASFLINEEKKMTIKLEQKLSETMGFKNEGEMIEEISEEIAANLLRGAASLLMFFLSKEKSKIYIYDKSDTVVEKKDSNGNTYFMMKFYITESKINDPSESLNYKKYNNNINNDNIEKNKEDLISERIMYNLIYRYYVFMQNVKKVMRQKIGEAENGVAKIGIPVKGTRRSNSTTLIEEFKKVEDNNTSKLQQVIDNYRNNNIKFNNFYEYLIHLENISLMCDDNEIVDKYDIGDEREVYEKIKETIKKPSGYAPSVFSGSYGSSSVINKVRESENKSEVDAVDEKTDKSIDDSWLKEEEGSEDDFKYFYDSQGKTPKAVTAKKYYDESLRIINIMDTVNDFTDGESGIRDSIKQLVTNIENEVLKYGETIDKLKEKINALLALNVNKPIEIRLGGPDAESGNIKLYKPLSSLFNEICAKCPQLISNEELQAVIKANIENGVNNSAEKVNNKDIGSATVRVPGDDGTEKLVKLNENYPRYNLGWSIYNNEEGIPHIKFYYKKPNGKAKNIRMYEWGPANPNIHCIKNISVASVNEYAMIASMGAATKVSVNSDGHMSAKLDSGSKSTIYTDIELGTNKKLLVNRVDFGNNYYTSGPSMESSLSKGQITLLGDPSIEFGGSFQPYTYPIYVKILLPKNNTQSVVDYYTYINSNKEKDGNMTYDEWKAKASLNGDMSFDYELSGYYNVSKISHRINSSGFETTLDIIRIPGQYN